LAELFVDNCGVTNENIVTLCAHGLMESRSLRLIDMQYNAFDDEASMSLTLLFNQLRSTTFRVIEGNNVSDETWDKVRTALGGQTQQGQ
jgi:Ran GTPase-activating protein (RanGAP) involved in mRNA processing and transport